MRELKYLWVFSTFIFVCVSSLVVAQPSEPSAFIVWDNFDGRNALVQDGGSFKPPYLRISSDNPRSNIRLAYVRSGQLVAPIMDDYQLKVATYTGADIKRLPTELSAAVIFGPGKPGGAVALISTQAGVNSLQDITGTRIDAHSGSVHIVFTDMVTLVQYFDQGTLITVRQIHYKRLSQRRRSYRVGWSYLGGGLFHVHLPDGRTESVKNYKMALKLGRYVIFEHYYKRGQTTIALDWISAR